MNHEHPCIHKPNTKKYYCTHHKLTRRIVHTTCTHIVMENQSKGFVTNDDVVTKFNSKQLSSGIAGSMYGDDVAKQLGLNDEEGSEKNIYNAEKKGNEDPNSDTNNGAGNDDDVALKTSQQTSVIYNSESAKHLFMGGDALVEKLINDLEKKEDAFMKRLESKISSSPNNYSIIKNEEIG